MATTTVSAKGQIVIPAKVRKRLGMKAGTKVYFNIEGQNVLIIPIPDDPINAACGFLAGGKSLSKDLEKSRKEEGVYKKASRYR
jgi:AbrB family looped-hinge helix DNA binding protein